MKKKRKNNLKRKTSKYPKLSLFHKPGIKFFRPCPLSEKNAPPIDYKNIKLLKKYISEGGRILPSRITAVSQKKQKKLKNTNKKKKEGIRRCKKKKEKKNKNKQQRKK